MGAIGHNLPKNGKTYAGRHKKGSLTEKPQLKKQKDFYCAAISKKPSGVTIFRK